MRQSDGSSAARSASTVPAPARSPVTMRDRASARRVSGDCATACGVPWSPATAAPRTAVRCSASSVPSVARYPAAGSAASTWGTGSAATISAAAGGGCADGVAIGGHRGAERAGLRSRVTDGAVDRAVVVIDAVHAAHVDDLELFLGLNDVVRLEVPVHQLLE